MTLNRYERENALIARAVSEGKTLERCGERYAVCRTCNGAGTLPPLLPGDGFGVICSECHGNGTVKLCKPKACKFGPISERLDGGKRESA